MINAIGQHITSSKNQRATAINVLMDLINFNIIKQINRQILNNRF